jgi:GT2 family glycosyltransferase
MPNASKNVTPNIPTSRPTADLPITFALFTYNQEKYVCDAVLGALAQTYSPLEILILDDASQDETQAAIYRMVSEYTGNHTVRLCFNKSNAGLSAQINKCFKTATGKFIILASGDDISKPFRTSRVVDLWLRKGRKPSAIFCGIELMDGNGTIRGAGHQRLKTCSKSPEYLLRNIHNPPRLLVGACSSFSPSVIRGVGDLHEATLIEDTPLTLRASIMGGVEFIDEILVSYRIGSSSWLAEQNERDTSLEQRIAKRMKLANAQRSALQQIHDDFQRLGRRRLEELASGRILAKDITISILSRRKVPLRRRIIVAFRSSQWREMLIEGTIYSIPRLARFAMLCKNVFRRTAK